MPLKERNPVNVKAQLVKDEEGRKAMSRGNAIRLWKDLSIAERLQLLQKLRLSERDQESKSLETLAASKFDELPVKFCNFLIAITDTNRFAPEQNDGIAQYMRDTSLLPPQEDTEEDATTRYLRTHGPSHGHAGAE